MNILLNSCHLNNEKSQQTGRSYAMNGASIIRQHQNRKFVHVFKIQRISERRSRIRVPISVKSILASSRVDFDVTGRRLLTTVKHLQITYITISLP